MSIRRELKMKKNQNKNIALRSHCTGSEIVFNTRISSYSLIILFYEVANAENPVINCL